MCFIAKNKAGNCHLCDGNGKCPDCGGEGCLSCRAGECRCQWEGVTLFDPDRVEEVSPKIRKDLYGEELVNFLKRSLCG